MTASVYDMTMDLRDEYTALVSRKLGEQLQATLNARLSALPEGGVLLLDFTVVTSIHESFVDEFLIPVLQSVERGEHGDRYVVGINVDVERLTLSGVGKLLNRNNLLLLVLQRDGRVLVLGSPDEKYRRALEFVHESGKQTDTQLAIQMDLSIHEARVVLEELADHRVLKKRYAREAGLDYFEALLDPEEFTRLVNRSLEADLLERIDAENAIERNVHYQLPSGLHAAEFLHLSRVLEDARFTTRLGLYLAEAFKESQIDVIVTTKMPNNLVLAQVIGDYLEAKIVPAVLDQAQRRFLPASSIRLTKDQRALVLVDVVATGWIVSLLCDLAARSGLRIEGVAAVVDLSEGKAMFPSTKTAMVASLNLSMFPPSECPLCKQEISWVPARVLPRL